MSRGSDAASPPAASAAVFLDRDGVLNRNVFNPSTGAWEAPHRPDDFIPVPGVLPALGRLTAAGFRLFLVSNQPDYALGKTSLAALDAIHQRLLAHLAHGGISFTAFYYCRHHPRGIVEGYSGPCICRKPSPHFLQQAASDYLIDLARSWMIGDRASDVACGLAAGARTIRIAADHPEPLVDEEPRADLPAADLTAAVAIILDQRRRRRTHLGDRGKLNHRLLPKQ